MVKNPLLWIVLLLCACTTDPVSDEEFEMPTFDFPLLGNVPDHPTLPEPQSFIERQKRLQTEHDQATKKEAEIIKLTKP
ncbi:MAG: hypothetical protein ACOH2E_06880 [Candidatus Paracaedibacter sp.]|jgi:hypothetical protein